MRVATYIHMRIALEKPVTWPNPETSFSAWIALIDLVVVFEEIPSQFV